MTEYKGEYFVGIVEHSTDGERSYHYCTLDIRKNFLTHYLDIGTMADAVLCKFGSDLKQMITYEPSEFGEYHKLSVLEQDRFKKIALKLF